MIDIFIDFLLNFFNFELSYYFYATLLAFAVMLLTERWLFKW